MKKTMITIIIHILITLISVGLIAVGCVFGMAYSPICFLLLIFTLPIFIQFFYICFHRKKDNNDFKKPNYYINQMQTINQPFMFDYPFRLDEIQKIISLIQQNELTKIHSLYPQLSHLNIAIIAEYIVGLMVNNYLGINRSSLNTTMRTKLTYDYLPHQTAPGNMSDFMYINHQTKQVIIVETTTYRRINSIINNEVNPITRHLRDLLQVNPTLNTYHIKVILVSPFSAKFSFFNNNSSKQDMGWLIKSFKNNIYPILSQFNYQHSFEDVLHYFSFTDLNNPNNINSLIINPPVFNQQSNQNVNSNYNNNPKQINLEEDQSIYL